MLNDLSVDLGELPGGRLGSVRRILEGPNPSRFKSCDLINCAFQMEDAILPSVTRDFYDLVTACAKHDVKLQNVDGRLIEEMMKLETLDMENHGRKISSVVISLESLHQSSFLLEFPHLETINIWNDEEVGVSELCSMPSNFFERETWPNLKDLSVHIDSPYLSDESTAAGAIFDYFFTKIMREKMESLALIFDHQEEQDEDRFPLPRIIDVCRSCPNLKELTIIEWPGSNKAISKLWGNLPLLETVSFECCRRLGNVAFVGKDKEEPAFHQAKNLRSLELVRLEEMPKITDTIFTLVLRHASLKELSLQSSNTINKISLTGLSSLQDGVFSETIEKLTLDIDLDGVTPEELKTLQKKFRSWRML